MIKMQSQKNPTQPAGESYAYIDFLGLKYSNMIDVFEQVYTGLDYEVFNRLQTRLGLQTKQLAEWVQITPSTLARRHKQGHFSKEESDRLLRFSRVFVKALKLFDGDLDKTRAWFSNPVLALADRAPQTIVETEVGAREIENLIGRLEHGVFC